ncbi:MAG: hypothetical protein ACYC4Q_11410 [Victivallaceae bacterium]
MKYQIGKLLIWTSMVICLATLAVCPLYAADEKTGDTKKEEVISEEIKPEAIKPEQGFCYIATLTLGREADNKGKSECILLEDGKPLSAPHSYHKEIREIGKGKYSHWTVTAIYFSASDNSDPRTNGRKYTLVSTKK